MLVLVLAGCATQSDVRNVCASHHGVAAVNGNAFHKYVACRDGYYKAIGA